MSGHINKLIVWSVINQKQILNSIRFYGRWMHRNPAKVMLPYDSKSQVNLKKEKIIDIGPEILNKSGRSGRNVDLADEIQDSVSTSQMPVEKSIQIKAKRQDKLKKQKLYLSQKKVFDDNEQLIYQKLNDNDGRVSNLLVKLKSKKERSRSGQTLVEGWRLIVDGLEAKCMLKYVIFSQLEDLNNLRPFLPRTGVTIYKVPYKEIQLWSDVETSPGILGVFETPSPDKIKRFTRPLPLNFICDNIRIPGNLGAILRAAVGVGCEKIMLSKGCVDVWDPKVIRSASGAHFRLPIHHSIEWTEMPKFLEPDTSIFIADSNATVSDDTNDTIEEVDSLHSLSMPVLPYYGVQFSSLKHITLIIGGETEGISEESYRLAASKNGLRLNIPLEKGVDSLNTGMATAVIAFEMKKQLIQSWAKAKLERQMGHAA